MPYPGQKKFFGQGFQPIESSRSLAIDTQAFHYNDDENNVLVFRGTEPSKIGDILSDLSAPKIPYPYADGAGQVHRGFFNAFEAVKAQIEEIFDKPENQKRPTLIAGHSLGGALATLAGALIAEKYRNHPCGKKVMVYTYGSPRVGDVQWVRYFTQSRPFVHFRHRHQNDIVPMVPPPHLEIRYTTVAAAGIFALSTVPAGAAFFCLLNSGNGENAYAHHGQGVWIRQLDGGEPYLIPGEAAAELVIADGKQFGLNASFLANELAQTLKTAFGDWNFSGATDHSMTNYVGLLAKCLRSTILAWKKDPEKKKEIAKQAARIHELEIRRVEQALMEIRPEALADATMTHASRRPISEAERKAHLENTLAVIRKAKLKAEVDLTVWSGPDAKQALLQSIWSGEVNDYVEEELDYLLKHIS